MLHWTTGCALHRTTEHVLYRTTGYVLHTCLAASAPGRELSGDALAPSSESPLSWLLHGPAAERDVTEPGGRHAPSHGPGPGLDPTRAIRVGSAPAAHWHGRPLPTRIWPRHPGPRLLGLSYPSQPGRLCRTMKRYDIRQSRL